MYSLDTMGAEIVNRSASGHWATRRAQNASLSSLGENGFSMYIGVGTLVVILIIVLIIYFIRRS